MHREAGTENDVRLAHGSGNEPWTSLFGWVVRLLRSVGPKDRAVLDEHIERCFLPHPLLRRLHVDVVDRSREDFQIPAKVVRVSAMADVWRSCWWTANVDACHKHYRKVNGQEQDDWLEWGEGLNRNTGDP